MVEGAALEMLCGVTHRGFESHSLRIGHISGHTKKNKNLRFSVSINKGHLDLFEPTESYLAGILVLVRTKDGGCPRRPLFKIQLGLP